MEEGGDRTGRVWPMPGNTGARFRDMRELTPERALIFRITHIRNVPWLLRNGVCCRSGALHDPGFVEIGNPDLIAKRPHRTVPIPPGGNLSDYVPFYFTPHSPMLLNILTGYNGVVQRTKSEIVVLVSSLHRLAERGVPFVFTDRHAYMLPARYFADLADLAQVDWPLLRARNFKHDPNDPGKKDRYQAEGLVHHAVPVDALLAIACANEPAAEEARRMMTAAGVSLKIVVRPDWYFR